MYHMFAPHENERSHAREASVETQVREPICRVTQAGTEIAEYPAMPFQVEDVRQACVSRDTEAEHNIRSGEVVIYPRADGRSGVY